MEFIFIEGNKTTPRCISTRHLLHRCGLTASQGKLFVDVVNVVVVVVVVIAIIVLFFVDIVANVGVASVVAAFAVAVAIVDVDIAVIFPYIAAYNGFNT